MRSNRLSYRSFRGVDGPGPLHRERDLNPRPLLRRQMLFPLSYRGSASVAGVEPEHRQSGPDRSRTGVSGASTWRLNRVSFGTISGACLQLQVRIDRTHHCAGNAMARIERGNQQSA
jgi:hypothetical protein